MKTNSLAIATLLGVSLATAPAHADFLNLSTRAQETGPEDDPLDPLEDDDAVADASPLAKNQKVEEIKVPFDISEQSEISGYAFSESFKAKSKHKMEVTDELARGSKAFSESDLEKRIALDSAGAPMIGSNYLRIKINSLHPNAGSNTNRIIMKFGRTKQVNLYGFPSPPYSKRFPKGYFMTWDLNQPSLKPYMETIHTDLWDDISLVNPSGDGIKLDNIKIVHSGQTILNWNCYTWLDGSRLEKHGVIGLTAKILQTKLNAVSNSWIPQIHYAAREIGKSDGTKYGTSGAWCSEFSSWALRKELWNTPTGSIGSSDMENYFAGIGRKYTKSQILTGVYTLSPGDYVRFQWSGGGQHSGIFMKYIDSSSSPTENTRILCIEGNASATVRVATRRLRDVLSVGNTR